MARYTLYAEREGQRAHITDAETMEAATLVVDKMEEAETWPEGSDAILHDNINGEEFMYTDEWEAL